MKGRKIGDSYIVVHTIHERFPDTLISFCEKEKIESAFFYGLGAMLSATLCFYNLKTKEYECKNLVDGPYEVVNISGNVSLLEKKLYVHAHTTLGDKNLETIGGHVKEAVVGGTLELYVAPISPALVRKKDEDTGLSLIDLS